MGVFQSLHHAIEGLEDRIASSLTQLQTVIEFRLVNIQSALGNVIGEAANQHAALLSEIRYPGDIEVDILEKLDQTAASRQEFERRAKQRRNPQFRMNAPAIV
jgi:hypothetical protein